MTPLDLVLSKLDGVHPTSNGWEAKCPAHEDRVASLDVSEGDDRRALLHCQAGCAPESVVEALGLTMKDLFPRRNGNGASLRVEIEAYTYTDVEGKPLFEVVRFKPKTFRQRLPDGRWGLNGVTQVLYRLPKVIEAARKGGTIFVVEGEVDVHTLERLGSVATTNPGGAGKWREAYSETLRGARAIIFPDNDEPGRKHAHQVAASLNGKAAAIKIVELPDLPPKGDITDWMRSHTRDELVAVLKSSPTWTPNAEAAPKAEGKERGEIANVENLTDLGNARRLVRLHGADLRYCHPWKKWMVWDGWRWREDDTAEVERRAKATVLKIYGEAESCDDDKRRRQIGTWALQCESRGKLAAMIDVAASEPGVPILPAQLNTDPWALNLLNGTIDLRTGDLRPHRREDLITKLTPIEYDPTATATRWDRFLLEIMSDRPPLVAYLRRLFGYAMTGSTREQVLFFGHGSGANGKTTLLKAIRDAVGADYAKEAAPGLVLWKSSETHPTERADLFGLRLITTIEVEDGRRLAEVAVKQLTGSDQISARRMREDFWTFEPTHKIVLAANHKPEIRGTDFAMWRRIRLIPFEARFEKGINADETLDEKLAQERPGILAWLVRGAVEWYRDGLKDPPEVLAATEDYRREMDLLGNFIAERCVTGDDSYTVLAADLYSAYVAWSRDNAGGEPLSQTAFGRRLSERGFVGGGRDTKSGRAIRRGIGLIRPGERGDDVEV